MKVWRFLVMALAAACIMASDGWRRPFAVLGPDQGLPTGGIISLAQDSDGFIWVGTENGLLRYEGGGCSRWSRDEGLPSNFIQQLAACPGGGIWVGTAQGLARIQDGRVEAVHFGSSTEQIPTSMTLDGSGRLWVITTGGLFIQQEGARFSPAPFPIPGELRKLAAGAGGIMHLGTSQGVFSVLAGRVVQSFGPAEGLPKEDIALLIEDGEGKLWAGSRNKLVVKPKDGSRFTDASKWLPSALSPNSLPFRDHDGSIWIPTLAGALHVAGRRTELIDAAGGLPFRWVRTVLRDKEESLWFLGSSLARLQGSGRVWNHGLGSGASGQVVWAIARDPQGQILVGSDNGAFRLQPAGAKSISGTEGQRIKNLTFDPTGRLWMVSTLGPALWLDPRDRKATVAPLHDLGREVNTVTTDAQGTVWLGHAKKGLFRWDPTARCLVQEVAPNSAGLASLGVYRVREDGRGRLWVASTAGLFVRDAAGKWHLFNQSQGLFPFGVIGMAFLPDESAWLHFQEPVGLVRVRVEGDQLKVLERRRKGQGLPSDMVYAMDVDTRGAVWISTDQGLDRLDPGLHLGRQAGLISEDCAILALRVEPDRVWVGTAGGLVRYERGAGEALGGVPMAHVLQIGQGERTLRPPFGKLEPVPAAEASLSFRVATPSYRQESQVRIQVRLLGLEKGWRDLDAPYVRYPGLPGGTYRFETRAVGPEGQTGPTTSITVRVKPPWWRSWWAWAFYGILAVAAVMLLVRFRVAALARSKAELEALVARRTEELNSRNGELSLALSRVKQLSGLLPICASCKKIRDDRGYWNHLEQYISTHSEVDFTHGICPDCAESLYPHYTGRRAAKLPEKG